MQSKTIIKNGKYSKVKPKNNETCNLCSLEKYEIKKKSLKNKKIKTSNLPPKPKYVLHKN